MTSLDGVFHVKRRSGTPVSSLIQLGALALLACQSPSDVLYRVPDAPPLETVGGARLTTGVGPDVVRGFLSNGRVVFRTRGLLPGSADWMVASIAPTGGGGQEEASVYRQAILGDVATLVEKYGRRVLGVWLPASSGIHGCPAPAPAVPGVVGVTFYEIGPVDGAPLSSLAVLSLSTGAVNGAGTAQQRVRVTPALREVETLGVNPFGPVLAPDGRIVYSDGETIWRARIGADQDREAITTGSFPALSTDGRWLAAARPTGVDSAVQTFTRWRVSSSALRSTSRSPTSGGKSCLSICSLSSSRRSDLVWSRCWIRPRLGFWSDGTRWSG